jgi:hypothetical protein
MSEGTLSELLRRARGVSPPRDAKARMRARVLAVAVATSTAAGRAAAGTAEPAGTGVGKAAGQALVYALGGGVVGLLVLGPLLIPERSPPAEQRGATPVMSSAARRAPAAAQTSTASERAPSQVSAESSAPRPLPSLAVDQLLPSIDRETALLGEAQRALRRGDARAALGWLERYDREFPKGMLREEAAAARAMGACSLPSANRAQLLAQFRARFGGSPLVPRVAAACASAGSHDDFDLDSDPSATQRQVKGVHTFPAPMEEQR